MFSRFVVSLIFSQNFNIYNGGNCHRAAAAAEAEAALLNHVNSIPDGSIVLMAVFDAARPCASDCRAALALVGATPQAIDRRGRSRYLIPVKCIV